ncbi:MAG: hypothetical protein IKH43_04755 [Bacteroidaceae bacterium]|nr:hypothetical protein [Bacteroidaceae bacterium]
MNSGVKFGLLLGTFMLMTTLGYAQDIEAALNDAALRKQQELMDRRQARREKQIEKEKKKLEKKEKIDTQRAETYTVPVYMFAISAQFGDSVVYVTNLQKVDDAQLTRKYDYLAFRSEYSHQFNKYVTSSYFKENQVTSVVFDKNRKKALKRFNKILKLYEHDRGMHLMLVTDDRFHFTAIQVD